MRYPKPVLKNGKWQVDLRSWGFTCDHYLLGPGTLSEMEAVHLAYARLEGLRAARMAEPNAQLELRSGAPVYFSGAVDAWQAGKRYGDNAESKRYGDSYTRMVRAELGTYRLLEFCQRDGEERLSAWVKVLESQGKAARTIRNRLSIAGQVFEFCTGAARRWIPFAPALPEPPGLPPPRFDWISEATFRALRSHIYEGPGERDSLKGWLKRDDREGELEAFIERRRVYLSWLFYTGVRKADADNLTGDDVGLDVGTYVRRAQKTKAAPEQFDMPEPLADDLRAYLALVGREAFVDGEAIGGGRWPNAPRMLGATAAAMGLGRITPRILRRSFARKMFQLGYTIKEVAERMGHADTRMLNEIYVRTPRPEGRARTLWKRSVAKAPQPDAGGAKVLRLASARKKQ